jgi:hypothetical protein
LNTRHPNIQPAPRPIVDFTEQHHAQQQKEPGCVDRQGNAHDMLQGNIGDEPHDAQRDQHVCRLIGNPAETCIGSAV